MTLEQALKQAAYKVWDELEPIPQNSNYTIFEVREEALTTMAIKELYRSLCPQIEKIEMIPGSEESLKGYDFEIVIGSKLKGKYVRLFIQAKRLYGKKVTSNYDALDFKQTDDLIKYSRNNSSLGMYAFYNHLSEQDITLQNHYNSATLFDKKSMGITVASAYSVKMLGARKFSKYHFNEGSKINPNIYSLRHFPHLFYFHKDSRKHIAVPFHELSYFTIDMAEIINRLYRRIKAKNKTYFFFFFFSGIEKLFNDDKDIIPILNTNSDKLFAEFRSRTSESNKEKSCYNPEALIIIDTDEETLTAIKKE